MAPIVVIPKISIAPNKFLRNLELAQPLAGNAKGRDTEPGCEAYFFFIPEDGSQNTLYGIELYENDDALRVHGSSQPMQTFIAFQISSTTELTCSNSIKEEINSAPPEIGYGRVICGWLTREQETPRTSAQQVEFTKLRVVAGKRGAAISILSEAVTYAKDKHVNTLSFVVVEDAGDENVLYIFARFRDQAGVDAHKDDGFIDNSMRGVSSLLQSSEGGMYQEVLGFLTKAE